MPGDMSWMKERFDDLNEKSLLAGSYFIRLSNGNKNLYKGKVLKIN